MAKNSTKGTRQLACEIDSKLRDELDVRVKTERRTLRAVVEMALKLYLATKIDGEPKGK